MRHLEELAARWVTTLAATASVVLGLGLLVLAVELQAGEAPPAPSAAVRASTGDAAATGATPLALDDEQAPATLRIPAIEVEGEVIGLGLTQEGALEVPRGEVYDLPGWYVHGPRPGELGPAVIGGHVDSRSGPSVFHRLGALEPGDEIEVAYEDGTVARFTVDRAEHHPKESFPFDEVFGDTTAPELRLITCGGAFDHGSRSYDDNLVVFATYDGAAK
jgi:sortase (surface protein transpeptidase)